MKITKPVLFAICLIFSTVGFAQKPQEILGIAKEHKTKEYYKEQLSLWKQETEKTPKNTNAWYQRYRAKRAYLQKSQPKDWMSNQRDVLAELQKTIDASKKYIDKSYEYYLMESLNSRGSQSAKYSQLAYDINPERSETYEGLLVHYVLTFQKEKAKPIAKKMLDKNYYSNANLKWNYNALQTADKNGAIITHGDMDAIPKWVLQYGAGIREDVLVISKWIMTDVDDYRTKVLEGLNSNDIKDKRKDFTDPANYVNKLVVHMLMTSKRPIYIECGMSIEFFKQNGLDKDVYLVGTSFRYSKKGFDNLAVTKKNFEQVYDLEYLFNNFQFHTDDEIVKRYLNVAYVPGLMKLKKHYEITNEEQKVRRYESLIAKIAEDSGRKEEVMSWYK